MIELEQITEQYKSYKELCTQLFTAFKACTKQNAEYRSYEIISRQIVGKGKSCSATEDIADRLTGLCEAYRLLLAVPILEQYKKTINDISEMRVPFVMADLITRFKNLRQMKIEILCK